jgi:Flp pilus assembly protein TadD
VSQSHRRRRYVSRQSQQTTRRLSNAIERAANHLEQGEYAQTVYICQNVLTLAGPSSHQRAELLNCMGAAQMMQQDFAAAYTSFSEALAILPTDPYLWYNHGFASQFTQRSGQALRAFEQAVTLEGQGAMAQQYAEAAEQGRRLVRAQLGRRGTGFTLEQLIEQEELFQRGIGHMEAEAWADAAQCFRQAIALGDGPPQPWTNLGACLVMLQQPDEAAAAYQRALQLDPQNETARYSLQMLADSRAE